jgi:prepilin-type processing-associated H-X9-DG protein
MRRCAITRIEVAVVVVILGAALCGLVVWIQQAREAARRVQCGYNVANLTKGLRSYADTNGAFPRATVVDGRLSPEKRLSWYIDVLPYLESIGKLLLDRTQAWDADVNLPVRTLHQALGDNQQEGTLGVMPIFLCPSASRDLRDIKPGPTSYVGIAGIGEDAASLPEGDPRAGVFGYDRATRPDDIIKEQGDVLLLAETALDNGPWTAGGRPTVRGVVPEEAPCIGVGRQFGGNHPRGGNVAFVDGSVRFLSDDVDPKFFAAMATITAEKPEDEERTR